jgi:hypothetical protein
MEEKIMKKFTKKISVTLVCTTLLGGVVAPVAVPAFQNIVHAEDVNQQPISVLVAAVSAEDDTQLPFYNVTINPGETKTISAPKVEGWKLDQYTNPTYELTYDQALKLLNSAGFVWVQFWMIKDAAPTTKEPVIFTVAHRVAGGDDLLLDNAVVNPGESITLAPITVDGYVARADNKYTYTYDEVATGSSSLFVAEILYDKVTVEQPKDPNQDPSQNGNGNTGGGQAEDPKVEDPKTPEDPKVEDPKTPEDPKVESKKEAKVAANTAAGDTSSLLGLLAGIPFLAGILSFKKKES